MLKSRDIALMLALVGVANFAWADCGACDKQTCHDGCPITAAMEKLPKMTYKIGAEETCCSKSAAQLAEKSGQPIYFAVTDLRAQLLREGIGVVHAVVYTHEHADHILGLDDLRLFPFYIDGPVPLFCEAGVQARLLRSFDYAFAPPHRIHTGGLPQLELRSISTQPFEVLGARITPIRLFHGNTVDVLGFRFGNVAYCTDTNGIPEESMQRLEGLDVLILDALRPRPHATHFGLDEALHVARELKPRRTLFTHICHELEHEATCARLPDRVELAYDGMRVPL